MIFPDNEIEKFEEDKLGFNTYADMLKQLIADAGEAPFSIGINGRWGSGKTSLLRLLLLKLPANEEYITVWFNAWLYQGYQDARVALLEQLFEKIEDRKLRKQIAKIRHLLFKSIAIANGIRGPIIVSYLLSLFIPKPSSLDKDINNLRESIASTLGKKKKKLIFLVDDLDRCLPETALSTLEAVRLFLHMKHTVVILAGDKEILQQAVKKQFVLDSSDARVATLIN